MRWYAVSRRQFLGTVVSIGGAVFLQGCGAVPATFKFFDEHEAALVALVAEQIVPADDAPGATDAGVVTFVDRMLAGPYRKHQPAYRAGLRLLAATSERMYGRPCAALGWEEQTRLLQALESDTAPPGVWTEGRSSAFFSLIRDHTMQGFYGSPRHGGNRGFLSFKMLDFDVAPIVGQNRYGKG